VAPGGDRWAGAARAVTPGYLLYRPGPDRVGTVG